ncbi:MAG: Type 1 glutamine amidotransferase-like domain-containing protein [Bacilli bacterium]
MINILLSTYDFNNKYCFSRIKEYLKPNMKVVILPFSHDDIFYDREDYFNELYDYDFGYELNKITEPFRDYGIEKEDIYVLNPHKDSVKFMKYKIRQADVLFFTGGNPITFMITIKVLGLIRTIKEFNGIVIGASAGAMVQMKEFVTYPTESEDYDFGFYEGLGFIEDKDIIVHWDNKDYQFDAIIYSGIRRDIDFMLLEDGKCKIIKKEE